MNLFNLVASALDEPLDVVNAILGVAGLVAGVASAIALLSGRKGSDVADAATRGAAGGFILGVFVGLATAVYFVLD